MKVKPAHAATVKVKQVANLNGNSSGKEESSSKGSKNAVNGVRVVS